MKNLFKILFLSCGLLLVGCTDDFEKINHELEAYSPKLARRMQLVVANKMDLPDSEENLVKLKEYV